MSARSFEFVRLRPAGGLGCVGFSVPFQSAETSGGRLVPLCPRQHSETQYFPIHRDIYSWPDGSLLVRISKITFPKLDNFLTALRSSGVCSKGDVLFIEQDTDSFYLRLVDAVIPRFDCLFASLLRDCRLHLIA